MEKVKRSVLKGRYTGSNVKDSATRRGVDGMWDLTNAKE
jgi:hypothetical protein